MPNANELTAIKALHAPGDFGLCLECGQGIPCDTAIIADGCDPDVECDCHG